MKSRILPIVLLVIFLVSLFPATLAQEETDTAQETDTATAEFAALETETEAELQTIDSANCWSDKPDYTPGVDKGFFIWQGTCGKFWWIDWSGDTRVKWKIWYKIIHNTEPSTEEPTVEEVLTLENQAATIDTSTLTTEEITELQSTGEIVSTGTTGTNTGGVTGAQILSNIRERIASNTDTAGSTEGTGANSAIAVAKKWLIKRPKLMYRVKGVITSNGQIYDVGVRKFDRRDKIVFRPYKNTITFHGWVGPHFDGIFFRTTGDKVTFNLEFDGQKSTELIYIGKDKAHPESNPFTLTGEPADKRVCKVGNIIYNKKCVNQVAGIAMTPNGLAGDLADKEAPTEPIISPAGPLIKRSEQARIRWEAVNQERIEKVAKLEELKAKPAFVKFREELNFRARQINPGMLKEAKQNYVWIKQKLVKAKDRSKLAHTKFLDAKQRLVTCTENCEELETEILQNAKDFLINTADSIITNLEKVKNKVESSEDLTEEEASEIITKIETEIQELEDAKAAVEAAETKEEFREATKTILTAWKKIKRHVYLHVGKLVNARHGGIVVKLKHLELRLQKVLEKMEEAGKDTSEIQPMVDEFHSYLVSAEENFQLAKEKFNEFEELPEPKGEEGSALIKEAQSYMNEARKSLEAAHKKLKEIVSAIKEAEGATELAETTVEEAEEVEAEEGLCRKL